MPCASNLLVACAAPTSVPWPRQRAWRGPGRTRSSCLVSNSRAGKPNYWATYGLILDLLGLAALERNAVALVLEALGSDQPLDLGSLGVGSLALTLGLDLAANDVLADLLPGSLVFSCCLVVFTRTASRLSFRNYTTSFFHKRSPNPSLASLFVVSLNPSVSTR